MANLADISDIKHRIAVTGEKINAAAQEDHVRNARMVDFLERVENNIVRKQQRISYLEEEQSRSLEENQRLKTLLHDMLAMADNTLVRGPRLALDDLEQLVDRLGGIVSMTNQDAEEGATSGDSAKEPDAPPVRKRRASKVFAFFGSPRT